MAHDHDNLLGVGLHLVVVDLLPHEKVDILSSRGTMEETLAALNCKLHQLDSYGQPSNPPLFPATTAAAQPTMAFAMHGSRGLPAQPRTTRNHLLPFFWKSV